MVTRLLSLARLLLLAGVFNSLGSLGVQAQTVYFTAQAFSYDGRGFGGGYVGAAIGGGLFGDPDNEALQVAYYTSGLPYVPSQVVYRAPNGVLFDPGTGDAMRTRGAGFSTDPLDAIVPSNGSTSTLTQNFYVGTQVDGSDSDFQQGAGNDMVTYVRLSTNGEELGGTFTGPRDLLDFNQAEVEVTFTRLGETRPDLPATFTLSGKIGIQTTPAVDPKSFNFGTTGAFRDFLEPVRLKGHITLQACVDQRQTLTFRFQPTEGGTAVERQATLDTEGAFEVRGVVPGTYKVKIKGKRWLARSLAVTISSAEPAEITTTLLGGDANNDNSVDIYDLGTLAEAFNTLPDEANWNENCDFNCDRSVDIYDLALLAENFNTLGDP